MVFTLFCPLSTTSNIDESLRCCSGASVAERYVLSKGILPPASSLPVVEQNVQFLKAQRRLWSSYL